MNNTVLFEFVEMRARSLIAVFKYIFGLHNRLKEANF